MKKYIVAIEEVISQEFSVKAENVEQAIKIAEEKYRKCEFVLEPGEVSVRKLAVIKPNNETTEWIEF